MNEDDDLPVLTQILRTGVPGPAPTVARPDPEPTGDALDPRTVVDAPWATAPLVIGHEPPQALEGYSAPSSDAAPPVSPVDDAAPPDQSQPPDPAPPVDAFVLSQDHDAPQAPHAAYDEPEYSAATPVEVPHEDPAAFAERIRDAVLGNLGARIDTELDARIAQAIHSEVETALGQLQAHLRAQVAEALKDVVGRAVDEEIARLSAARSAGGA